MGKEDRQKGRLSRLALKFGTVASAAAALLADSAAKAHEGDILASMRNRGEVVASAPRDEGMGPRPLAPLVLKPSHQGTRWMLAGHRSHSSHKSHSSHVSGSSHSSHFSSSIRPSSSADSPASSPYASIPPASTRSSRRAASAVRVTPHPDLLANPAPGANLGTKAPAALVAESTPAIDLNNPLHRYKLITMSVHERVQMAFIRDLLTGSTEFAKVGEKVGDCTLMEIATKAKSVRLRPPVGADFTVSLGKTGK